MVHGSMDGSRAGDKCASPFFPVAASASSMRCGVGHGGAIGHLGAEEIVQGDDSEEAAGVITPDRADALKHVTPSDWKEVLGRG